MADEQLSGPVSHGHNAVSIRIGRRAWPVHKLVITKPHARVIPGVSSGFFEPRPSGDVLGAAVIDGVWSTVGSTNMELWSFLRDDEVNAVILGRGFGAQMEEMFARDLEKSNPITLGKWEKRPLADHIAEWFGRLFGYWF